jgi:hypothetical protein
MRDKGLPVPQFGSVGQAKWPFDKHDLPPEPAK